jgi:tetratricopeptide (TPR) repeat protein
MIVLIKANLRVDPPRTELAESILDQALSIDANNAELHFLQGRRQVQASQLALAMQSYRRAIALRPDYADAHMALALQLLAGANYDEALQHFQIVDRLVADRVEVRLGLGNAYRATKQWEKSKQELDRVLAVSPRSPEAHFALGLLYLEAGENYPGLDLLGSLQRAQQEFQAYREIRASGLASDDPVTAYLEEITRSIEREQRRRERDAARAAREAERAARRAAQDAGTGGGSGGAESGGGESGGGSGGAESGGGGGG